MKQHIIYYHYTHIYIYTNIHTHSRTHTHTHTQGNKGNNNRYSSRRRSINNKQSRHYLKESVIWNFFIDTCLGLRHLHKGNDVWCMMYDVWCMMYDIWYMMYDVWCMMYDVWCQAGILHRDVKPENLLLKTSPGGKLSVLLCDFGESRMKGMCVGCVCACAWCMCDDVFVICVRCVCDDVCVMYDV